MAVLPIIERQYALHACFDLGADDVGPQNMRTVGIRPDAYVLSMAVVTVEAFDAGAKLTITDGTTKYVDAVDLSSVGSETVTFNPKHYPAGATLMISIEFPAGQTAKKGRVIGHIADVKPNNSHEYFEGANFASVPHAGP